MKHFLILVLSIIFLSSSGQEKNSEKTIDVTGTALDAGSKEPLPFVTVSVRNINSKELITGTISDEKGQFILRSLPTGEYLFDFQFIGYQAISKIIRIEDKKNISLEQVYLEEESIVLEDVEVTADRSTIEQKADRKIINIGKDLATLGSSAADIMVNVPTVNIDVNGNISMRGNENVRVLVNGKPTNLDPVQLLQQIPATSIKSVEVITNPSAKYIPDGMSGIINIVLHKNTQMGVNGSLNSGFTFGRRFRFAGSGGINYGSERINVYASYGNNYGVKPIWGTINRPLDPSRETWVTRIDPVSHLIKAGIDYHLSDQTTISAYSVHNLFKNDGSRFASISFPDNASSLSDFSQTYNSLVDNHNGTYNVDIQHTFDEGGAIELEVDFSDFNSNDNSLFLFEGQGSVDQDNAYERIGIGRNNTTVNLDYTKSITKNDKLEVGAEYRVQNTSNSYDTDNLNFTSSGYAFNRDIYSFYTNYSFAKNQWSYQAGARFEYFDTQSLLDEEGSAEQSFGEPIFSVYPSAYISYSPDQESRRHVWSLSLSRRVDRPNLQQVTPIRVWSSPRITDIGNPALIPQFTNSVELNYTRQLAKGSISGGAFFRKIGDEITRFVFPDPLNDGNIFYSYDNYRKNEAYGLEVSGSYEISTFWSFNYSFDLYTQLQRGLLEDDLQEVRNTLYNLRMNHSIKATDKLTFQVVALYRAPNTNLQYKLLAFHFVNVGARYSLFEGDGTVGLGFNDIFKGQNLSFVQENPVTQDGVFHWDSRTLVVSYSHRFGKGKNRSVKRKKRDRNEARSQGF